MAFLNIINQVKESTSKIISEKGYDNVDFVVEYSRSGFGDITCNIAFLLAKNLKKKIHRKLLKNLLENIILEMI